MTDFLPWEEFQESLRWRQGEHLTLVGPTSAGKTTLALHLLPRRTHTIVFATKKRAPLIKKLARDGYETVKTSEEIHPQIHRKYILAPPFQKGIRSVASQRENFRDALDTVFRQTGWAVYLDEVPYICEDLGLGNECKRLLLQGRTLGVTMAAATQRPVNIPLAFYSQARHLCFWQTNDERDLQRIGGLGGISAKEIRQAVTALRFDKHEVLYVNTRTRKMIRTVPPRL